MAPSLTETVSLSAPTLQVSKTDAGHNKESLTGYNIETEAEISGTTEQPPASFPDYLPVWGNESERHRVVFHHKAHWQWNKYPPLQPFKHCEHGKDADLTFPDLLNARKVKTDDITPFIGTEVHGVQLSQLPQAGKDQLALFVAQRRVVAFRDQDFASLPIQETVDFAGYFGRHHIHQTSGAPRGFPQIHLVFRGADDRASAKFLEQRTNTITWHSDVTFEKQPPGTTFQYGLDGPSSGGDTLFGDMAQAYQPLSPGFRHLEKALFVNPQFTRYIVGYKKEESDALKFLYDHIALSQDLQCRIRWKPGTVVVWDDRLVAQSAVFDWEDGQRRHIARLTPQAEIPYETPFES